MNDEPIEEELHEDDNEPATKSFIRSEARDLRTEIEGVDQRLINVEQDVRELKDDVKELKEDVKDTKETMKRVLNVVQTVEKNTRDIPAKVERLNRAVFPHR